MNQTVTPLALLGHAWVHTVSSSLRFAGNSLRELETNAGSKKVKIPAAGGTERDQVVLVIVSQPAARLELMHSDCGERTSELAAPAVAIEDLLAEFLARFWVDPQAGGVSDEAGSWGSANLLEDLLLLLSG